MGSFIVKCDECKKNMGTTKSMAVSAQGGTCTVCRLNIQKQLKKFKTMKRSR